MFGGPDPATGVDVVPPLELVRLAIPRRVYTEAQLAYVGESVIAVHKGARNLRGMRITHGAPFLRHFTAALEEPTGEGMLPVDLRLRPESRSGPSESLVPFAILLLAGCSSSNPGCRLGVHALDAWHHCHPARRGDRQERASLFSDRPRRVQGLPHHARGRGHALDPRDRRPARDVFGRVATPFVYSEVPGEIRQRARGLRQYWSTRPTGLCGSTAP
jgi:hypothetical protein